MKKESMDAVFVCVSAILGPPLLRFPIVVGCQGVGDVNGNLGQCGRVCGNKIILHFCEEITFCACVRGPEGRHG